MLNYVILACFFVGSLSYQGFYEGLQHFEEGYPGAVNPKLQAYVPYTPYWDGVKNSWFWGKEIIRIGIGPTPNKITLNDTILWNNTANNIYELHDLALSMEGPFKQFLTSTFDGTPPYGYPNYGPNNAHAVKTLDSMLQKEQRMIEQGNHAPWEKMNDALRGTIVVNTVPDLSLVVNRLINISNENSYVWYIDNKYEHPKASGYVGIHCLILFKDRWQRTLITEVQIHLFDIMDGTDECPKEYTHFIYEQTRALEKNDPDRAEIQRKGDIAQMLVFLYGIDRALQNTTYNEAIENSTFLYNNGIRYYYDTGLLFKVDHSSGETFVYVPSEDRFIPSLHQLHFSDVIDVPDNEVDYIMNHLFQLSKPQTDTTITIST